MFFILFFLIPIVLIFDLALKTLVGKMFGPPADEIFFWIVGLVQLAVVMLHYLEGDFDKK